MITIKYGKGYSDDTFEYIITTDCKTVGKFIDEYLKYEKEWGQFRILTEGVGYFDSPVCEYKYGKIIGKPLPKDILDKEIIEVSGSGGWSRSDFNLRV